MKITSEHFAHLKSEIDQYLSDSPHLIKCYENGHFYNSGKVKDLQIRFCWDVYYGVPDLNKWICDNCYPYLNDSHILTALKKILPKVTRQY